MYKHIKPNLIEQNMFNNQEMVKEFIKLYRSQTPIDFQKLKEASIAENFEEISNSAHHIKPTMEYIGASHLKAQLQKVELLAKEANDIASIQIEVHSLAVQFDELYDELELFDQSL